MEYGNRHDGGDNMDVNDFLKNIRVDRTDDFSCEFEVTEKAMESYCRYPYFYGDEHELISKKRDIDLKKTKILQQIFLHQ